MTPLLNIQNLHVRVQDTPILQGVSLNLAPGEIVALMGPNGSGKSTLAHVLMGHPAYQVTAGTITYQGHNLLSLTPEGRARAGVFLSFQYPQEVAGVTLGNMLRLAYNSTHQVTVPVREFVALLKQKMDLLRMPHDFMLRSLNEGFSGGEKKRAEMLQLAVLEPRLAILDETDSGLDIDALKTVAQAVQAIKVQHPDLAILLITHYQRILNYLTANKIVVMRQGTLVKSGGYELITAIESHGYDAL